jgi:hypothetical protein
MWLDCTWPERLSGAWFVVSVASTHIAGAGGTRTHWNVNYNDEYRTLQAVRPLADGILQSVNQGTATLGVVASPFSERHTESDFGAVLTNFSNDQRDVVLLFARVELSDFIEKRCNQVL